MARRKPTPAQLQALRDHGPKKGGPSPNPKGRPRGLAASIREMTNDGQAILRALQEIAFADDVKPGDRVRAMELMLQRGWGKAPEISLTGELDASTTQALADVGTEEIHALISELRKAG